MRAKKEDKKRGKKIINGLKQILKEIKLNKIKFDKKFCKINNLNKTEYNY